jgi:hypothetical protein
MVESAAEPVCRLLHAPAIAIVIAVKLNLAIVGDVSGKL